MVAVLSSTATRTGHTARARGRQDQSIPSNRGRRRLGRYSPGEHGVGQPTQNSLLIMTRTIEFTEYGKQAVFDSHRAGFTRKPDCDPPVSGQASNCSY